MRALLAFCMIVTTTFAWARSIADEREAAVVRSEFPELKCTPDCTRVHPKTQNGETCAAAAQKPVRKGTSVANENATAVNMAESRATAATVAGAAHAMHVNMSVNGDSRVSKARGASAMTVAEVVGRRAELKDQIVLVRGKVVKYNSDIMGWNWLHLRDGSGSAVDESNDLVVTTEDEAKIGDVVTAIGIVRTDIDFGSGYTYNVLLEEATLQ